MVVTLVSTHGQYSVLRHFTGYANTGTLGPGLLFALGPEQFEWNIAGNGIVWLVSLNRTRQVIPTKSCSSFQKQFFKIFLLFYYLLLKSTYPPIHILKCMKHLLFNKTQYCFCVFWLGPGPSGPNQGDSSQQTGCAKGCSTNTFAIDSLIH